MNDGTESGFNLLLPDPRHYFASLGLSFLILKKDVINRLHKAMFKIARIHSCVRHVTDTLDISLV